MKKKIIILLLLVLSLLITGCTIKEGKKADSNSKIEEVEVNGDSLLINGYDLSLTEKGSFKELNFKYPKNTNFNSLGTYTILDYVKEESSNSLFKIGFSHYSYKSIDEVMDSDLVKFIGNKNYNGIDWNYYEVEGKNHNYAMKKDNDVYVIDFIYDEDLQQFEEEFMKNVKVG